MESGYQPVEREASYWSPVGACQSNIRRVYVGWVAHLRSCIANGYSAYKHTRPGLDKGRQRVRPPDKYGACGEERRRQRDVYKTPPLFRTHGLGSMPGIASIALTGRPRSGARPCAPTD